MNSEYIEQLIRKYGSVTSESLLDLIINVVEDAVLEEREACAKVCENICEYDAMCDGYYAETYAAAIRARGNT